MQRPLSPAHFVQLHRTVNTRVPLVRKTHSSVLLLHHEPRLHGHKLHLFEGIYLRPAAATPQRDKPEQETPRRDLAGDADSASWPPVLSQSSRPHITFLLNP